MQRTTALMGTLYFGIAAIGCDVESTSQHNADAAVEMRLERDAELSHVDSGARWTSFGRVSEIFQESCMPCHASTAEHPNASAKLDLGTRSAAYKQLVNAIPQGPACTASTKRLVVPGEPDESLLMEKLENTPGLCGSPMPKPGTMQAFAAIDAAEVAEIANWISAGAADD